MNQQIDKFFREKLEGTQRVAPAPAWEKIEAGLDRKNNEGLWLKVAAAILLLAVGTFLLWPNHETEKNVPLPIAEKKNQSKEVKPKSDQNKVTEEVVAEKKIPVETKRSSKKKHKAPVIIESENNIAEEQVTVAQNEVIPSVIENPEATEPIISGDESLLPVETILAENSRSQEEPVTLVYTAEEVNDKYLDKVALAKATSEQKKPSTFRKLLNKAYDLKNNQDPFGDLRQKKNEILALNFKSEKRSQNK
jgi:hypothetical protein